MAAVLACLVALLCCIPADRCLANDTASAAPFADTPADAWYVQDGSLAYLVEHGLMSGYADGAFGPDDDLLRGQLTCVLYRYAAADGYVQTDVSRYSDVEPDAYYADAVEWAYQTGVVPGYCGTNTFGPTHPLTRADFAGILHAFALRCGVDYTPEYPGSPDMLGLVSRGEAAGLFAALFRDVLEGAPFSDLPWTLGELQTDAPLASLGSPVAVRAVLRGETDGVTLRFGWSCADGAWEGDADTGSACNIYPDHACSYVLWCEAKDADGAAVSRFCQLDVWGVTGLDVLFSGGPVPASTVALVPTVSNDPGCLAFEYGWKLGKGEAEYAGEAAEISLDDRGGKYTFYVVARDPFGNVSTLATEAYAVTAAEPAVVVCVGDSYAAGGNETTWPHYLPELLHNATVYNVAVTGSGWGVDDNSFLNQIEATAASQTIDCNAVTHVVIAGGFNDILTYGEARSRASQTIDAARKAFPNAEVLVVPHLWPDSAIGTEDLLEARGVMAACKEGGVAYLDNAWMWLRGNAAAVQDDGRHPNALGARIIAQNIAVAVR